MSLLRDFLFLACRLDFTFSSTWLSSSCNALADSCSRFLYSNLFQLAPSLNRKPSSRALPRGGSKSTATFINASHGTYGMDWEGVLGGPMPRANADSSTTSSSTISTTKTGQSSLHLKAPSFNGSPPSAGLYSLKPSRPTSLMFAPFTSTPTSHSPHVNLPWFKESSGASRPTTASDPVSQSSPSPFPSCSKFSPSFNLPPAQTIYPSTQRAVSRSQLCSDVESLQPRVTRSTPPSIWHALPFNSSPTLHHPPTSVSPSLLPRPTPFAEELQSPSLVPRVALPARSLPFAISSIASPVSLPTLSFVLPTAHPSPGMSSSRVSVKPCPPLATKPHYSQVTVSGEEVLQPLRTKLYLEIDPSRLLALSSHLHWVHTPTLPLATPSL
ncbi:hypothetical protein SISSUDRAFT_1053771 [Sistotremastrum suecicum HHB10207 ss-3]|uniref:REJ domain-containing protein n=1 Tax=Sistotremastrum suecicum HHB10207 ss-3 TaxID=1314776 RepID=A0A165Z066_9AGAM|nr:hypothetical protein SISSUDRAFT_1053771 [Sistotremastrum suecicum HHB10207 ss-3]